MRRAETRQLLNEILHGASLGNGPRPMLTPTGCVRHARSIGARYDRSGPAASRRRLDEDSNGRAHAEIAETAEADGKPAAGARTGRPVRTSSLRAPRSACHLVVLDKAAYLQNWGTLRRRDARDFRSFLSRHLCEHIPRLEMRLACSHADRMSKMAARPTRDEMLARIHSRERVTLKTPAAVVIREQRESARGHVRRAAREGARSPRPNRSH
jgi:hypothetical protein